jgi:hypothetical protein
MGKTILKVEDDKGNESNVKKSDVKLINEVENVKQLTEQTKANIIHKTDEKIKKSGVDSNNIIETKRTRKTNSCGKSFYLILLILHFFYFSIQLFHL